MKSNNWKEYSVSNTSLWIDWENRAKKNIYSYIDPVLLKRSPRKILDLIKKPQYVWKIEDLNVKFLEKLVKSLRDIREFKKTIHVLDIPVYNLIKEDFLNIVADFHNQEIIDEEDYELLDSKFSLTMEVIDKRDAELKVSRVEVDSKQQILNALQYQEDAIKPAEFIRSHSNVQLKNRTGESDEEYNELVEKYIHQTNGYIKLTDKYKLDKERKKIIKYFKIFIQCNPNYLCDNCFILWNWYYSTSKELHDLIWVYMKIPQKTIESFIDEANKEKVNIELFINFVFTTPWKILTEDRLMFGLKKQIYTLNPELFKYKHKENEESN